MPYRDLHTHDANAIENARKSGEAYSIKHLGSAKGKDSFALGDMAVAYELLFKDHQRALAHIAKLEAESLVDAMKD
jgi:hypothetical protein